MFLASSKSWHPRERTGAVAADPIPADRMIVATARVTNAMLMATDRRILDYAARGHLTALSG
jgi:PIN domain nuclease of toxin-antitoxin system